MGVCVCGGGYDRHGLSHRSVVARVCDITLVGSQECCSPWSTTGPGIEVHVHILYNHDKACSSCLSLRSSLPASLCIDSHDVDLCLVYNDNPDYTVNI